MDAPDDDEMQRNAEEARNIDILEEKLRDAMIPGFIASLTLEEAERAGAFREDALSEEDAWESRFDDVESY
jgi:hypothetical protein